LIVALASSVEVVFWTSCAAVHADPGTPGTLSVGRYQRLTIPLADD
jgi:hypothetical protein